MKKNYWYAVMQSNEDDDWGFGSYDLDEAKARVAKLKQSGCPDAYIAVIDEGGDPICINELRE